MQLLVFIIRIEFKIERELIREKASDIIQLTAETWIIDNLYEHNRTLT